MSKLIGRSYTRVEDQELPEVFNLMRVAHFIYGHQLALDEVRDLRFWGYSEIQRGLDRLNIWMSCEEIKNAVNFGWRFNFRVVGTHAGGLWMFCEDTRQVRSKDALIITPLDWSVYFDFLQVCKDNKVVERMRKFNSDVERANLVCRAIIEKNTSGLKEEDFH
jgi:hypothetical protein